MESGEIVKRLHHDQDNAVQQLCFDCRNFNFDSIIEIYMDPNWKLLGGRGVKLLEFVGTHVDTLFYQHHITVITTTVASRHKGNIYNPEARSDSVGRPI